MELNNLLVNNENIELTSYLGSLTNKILVESIFSKYHIDIVIALRITCHLLKEIQL